jgi:hypothetical protein
VQKSGKAQLSSAAVLAYFDKQQTPIAKTRNKSSDLNKMNTESSPATGPTQNQATSLNVALAKLASDTQKIKS